MTTTAHLHTVVLHWADLHEAAGTPSTIGGFGLGLRGYLAALNDTDTATTALDHFQKLATVHDETGRVTGYRCEHCGDVDPGHTHPAGEERNPTQIGQRPVPVRLHILETMAAIHADLLQCADAIAETVQRQPIAPPAPRRAAHARTRAERLAWEDHARRVQAAQDDAADRRRWRWTGVRPDAPYTALWLLGRVQGAPGPFRRLTEVEEQRIAGVARSAAYRLERALDIAAQRRTLEQRCACGGAIDVHGGEGRPPLAHCTGCGRVWTEGGTCAA